MIFLFLFCRKLLTEAKLGPKSSYSELEKRHGKDDRFRGVEKSRDRESLFNEFVLELRKKEKEERAERAKRARKDFFALLRENSSSIDRHSHWSDVKKQVHEMPVHAGC